VKIAVWGRNGRPTLNLTPRPEFSQIRIDSGPRWQALVSAMRLMAEGHGVAGRPPYRAELTLVREDGGRELIRYDGLGDGAPEAGARPVVDCVVLEDCDSVCDTHNGLTMRIPAERLVGPDVARAAAAAANIERSAEALVAATAEADAAKHDRDRLEEARRLKRQLIGRAAWIRERMSYISEKLWAFDDLMRAWSELRDLDAYTADVKRDHAATSSDLRAVERAEELELRAGADGALLNLVARVGWEVDEEVAALLATLNDAEQQAIDAEARQSRAQARLAAAKAALTGVDSALGAADARRCNRSAAVQAASLTHSIKQRQHRIDAITAEVTAFPARSSSLRLGKAMTVIGASLAIACLIGIVLVPSDAAVTVGELHIPLPAALLVGLAAGLLLTVFGLAEGMEVQAGFERRTRLESELVDLTRQQSWAQLQLRTLLGGRDLEDYLAALTRQDELEAERQERAAEVTAALGQVMSLRNQVDYVRTTMTRARERLTEICHAVGVGTPEAFLAQAEQCGRAMKALEGAALEVSRALGGRSRWSVGIMPELLQEEILASEAIRADLTSRVVDGSKLEVLSAEHAARLTEQQQLQDELRFIEAQLETVGAEVAATDVWECASRQIAAEEEAERLRAELPALTLARDGLSAAVRDMVETACSCLEGPATEVLQFMCENRCLRIGLSAIDGQQVEVAVAVSEPAASTERIPHRDLAVLGMLAVNIATAEMRTPKIRPLVVLAPCGAERPAFRRVLKRLSLTRQVILMAQTEGGDVG
jgi:hypothetical protein